MNPLFPPIRWLIWLFYPKIKVVGKEKVPDEPCFIIGNHSQMHGPITGEFYMPHPHYTWCVGEMMHMKEVPAYAFRDFWSQKPKWIRWFFRLLSYIIAIPASFLFKNANCIGVYHDARIMRTFKETVMRMEEGNHIIIFPEKAEPNNSILCHFQEGFVDAARLYYRRTGKKAAFMPLYIAPRLKKAYLGDPVFFDPDNDIEEERKRICSILSERITALARSLPEHTVVPYRNIPKKDYPTSFQENGRAFRGGRDYRGFRLNKINTPEYSHLKLLVGWLVYFLAYFLTEKLIPFEKCHLIHSPLDDLIPFKEGFILIYLYWFVLTAYTLLHYLLYNIELFKKVQIFIIITQIVAVIVYIIYPNYQDLRPAVLPRENFCSMIVRFIYYFDTNTGVCPSLHVAYSVGLASVWMKDREASWLKKLFVLVSVILIIASVSFVKQHSVIDTAYGILLGLFAEILVYGKDYWAPKLGLAKRKESGL